MRILAVDPGSKRIGLAISDPTGTIANPLTVIQHVARLVDAAAVAELADSHEAGLIVVGQSLHDDGSPSFEGRRSLRFAEALKTQTTIPVILWEESFTTQDARQARLQMGVSRKNRSGHLDDLAATVLLQSYLDANPRIMKRRRSCLPGILLLFMLVGILLVASVVFVPALAWQSFGPPGPSLNAWQRFSYALDLVWNAGDLTQPRDPAGSEQTFVYPARRKRPLDLETPGRGRPDPQCAERSERTCSGRAWIPSSRPARTGSARPRPAVRLPRR